MWNVNQKIFLSEQSHKLLSTKIIVLNDKTKCVGGMDAEGYLITLAGE